MEEKIIDYLMGIHRNVECIRRDVEALAWGRARRRTAASLRKQFEPTLGLIDVYLRAIDMQLEQDQPVMTELKTLHARFDGMEELIKANAREIGELKKKLPE